MKKGKVFGKTQIAVTVMVLALAGAIWLNMKYTPSSGKYLGEASYVSNSSSSKGAVQTSAKASEEKSDDYFTQTKKERADARKEAEESVKEALSSAKLTEDDKKAGNELHEKVINLENGLISDLALTVTVTIDQFDLTVETTGNGTVTLNSGESFTDNTLVVDHNASKTLLIKPEAGYQVSSISLTSGTSENH